MQNIQAYIDLLKAEVVPALGCTEPIAVALAVAKAREVLGEAPQQVELLLSPNIFKNGMGVGVPLTGITGLPIAAALGAFYGKSSDCLEVLKDVDNETVGNAKAFVKKGKVSIGVKKDSEKLYIEAICYGINGNTSKAIITTKHSNISQIEFNNEVIECSSEIKVGENENIGSVSKVISPLSVNSIFSFATTVPYSQIKFIHKTVEYNYAIAQEGLSKDYGLMVGKKLKEIIDKGILSDDIMNSAMSLTAAASDARMSGSVLPVMSNSGSGNQGLTATLPIYSVALQLKSDDEQIARALV